MLIVQAGPQPVFIFLQYLLNEDFRVKDVQDVQSGRMPLCFFFLYERVSKSQPHAVKVN